MNIADVALTRYSTKEFDKNRKISESNFNDLKTLLRFSPSSVNSQPWHFVIADTDEGKRKIAEGTQGIYSFNEGKVLDSSHVVLFCAKTNIDEEYMYHLLDTEEKDGRFEADISFKQANHSGRSMFVNMHRFEYKDAQHWMEKQVYLNMGTLLLGASAMGIDAVPIEGLEPKALDEALGLRQRGYTALAIIALGYRKDSDFNAKLPKSRLPETEIFTFL
ncbi:oxygen-insensitive NAD(P)H nitroreductase [Pseudoalteromonas sp. DL-6]|uniref:oxygen-insensitive NAD(P)H nitroreductase n=1 Tax=Pseudoalteromonas sp. DL-6 TaxID=1390185 RepID=UPI00103C0EE2|nr:oxygen-insensitive NAD(P)H nitroreductase [Pseudoalteromonas sp. DL-6]QBJ63701.1 NAD(P)H nitroreductase [Pseudoalteromonas sp. DL-6]